VVRYGPRRGARYRTHRRGTPPATILTQDLARNERMRPPLTLSCKVGVQEMADRELIAAILTAGMLPTLEIPRSLLDRTLPSFGRKPLM
jgi:hypothetical protein